MTNNPTDNLFQKILTALYDSTDTVATISSVLRLLGEHYGVSRAYIFEDQEDGSWCKNTFEWCAEGIKPEIDNLTHLDYSDLGGKESFMRLYDFEGVFFCPDVCDLAPELRAVLQPQGIRAMLQCSLLDNGKFCGYIGYDDCEDQHLWTSEQAGELSIISKLIGAFLIKTRKQDLADLHTDYQAALDKNSAYIYIIDPDSYEVVYCNAAFKKLYPDLIGKICYKLFLDDTAPCENCPMEVYQRYGSSMTVELRRPDGMWLSCQASPIRMYGKNLMMITCIDITSQKNADELLRQRSEEYTAVVRQSGKRVMRYDIRTGRAECYFEPVITTGFGRTIDGYVEKLSLNPRLDDKSRRECMSFFRSMSEGESEGFCDIKVANPDGTHMWVRIEYILIFDENRLPSHSIVTFINNTAQYEKQLAYEQWHESVATLSVKSSMFIEANLTRDMVEYQSGINTYHLVDKPFSIFLSRAKNEVIYGEDSAAYSKFFDRERLLSIFNRGILTDSMDFRILDATEIVWYRADVSLVKYPTNDDVKALIVFTNVDRDHREREYFARLASMDPLTGLLNREATHDAISDRLDMASSEEYSALFMIDLDNFKLANDRLGHQRGNDVLKSVSRALSELFTADDLLGRVGSDEFVGFVSGIRDTSVIAERAAAILDALFFSVGGVSLTASVGVAVCKGTEKTFDQLYVESDAALCEAKKHGKNQYCIGTDIASVPTRAESASMVQLKTLFEYMDGGVIMAEVDDDIHIVYVSPSYFKSLGIKPSELGPNYEKIPELIYPKDIKSLKAGIMRTAQVGSLLDITYRIGAEGKQWRHMRAARLPSGEDELPRIISVITDFTEMKAAETQLRVSQERYRLALSQSDVLIWEVDIAGRTLYQSAEAAASFGHTMTVFPDAPDSMIQAGIIHPDSEKEFRKMLSDVYSGDEGLEYSILARDSDGGFVWNRSGFRLIRDDRGAPIRAIGTVKKISNIDSDMRAFEQEIRFGATVEGKIVGAARANLSKNTVEHFIFPGLESQGLPMPTSYDELCDTLLDSIADFDVREEYRDRLDVDKLFRSYRQGENWLFSELQRISRDGSIHWSSSGLSLLRHPLSGDLYVFIYVRDITQSKSWETRLTVPITRDPSTMLFEKSTLRAVIENAIRQSEGQTALCSISCVEIAGLNAISKKNGAKVANDILFTLGRSFRTLLSGAFAVGRMSDTQLVVFRTDIGTVEQQQLRVETSRTSILSILRQTYPGIDIDIFFGFAVDSIDKADYETLYAKASLASRTARQWSDNPIVGYSEQELSPEEISQISSDTDASSARKTILVADDDEVARMIMRGVLDPIYNVVEAQDGAQALEALRVNHNISLVFLDIVMPELDGWQVLEVMRNDKRLSSIPVIVVTADGETENVVRALDHGATDVIAKPYQPIIITSRARNTLLRSEAARVALQNRAYEMRIQQQATLLRSAERDELTGLYNKQAFFRIVRETISRRPNEQYILLRFDIDRFKIYNELLGTEAGDRLLHDVGKSLQAQSTEELIFGRIESDHFVCFTRIETCDVALVTSSLNHWLGEYNSQFKLTASLGAYRLEDPNIDVSLMCDRALLAEKTVKNNYADKFAYYDSRLLQKILDEQKLAADIDEGISQKQIVPYYQPQYNQVTGEMVGAEALVRWNHPELGFISPGSFIPLFESNGLITRLDAYLWEEVCIYLRRRMDEKLPVVPISVNISRRDFYRLNLVEHLTALTRKYRLTPDMLRLEITESAYMDDPQQLIDITKSLQNAGFFIEMDDFGSGYSSLNTLKNVPVDLLKLDMKFLETGNGEGSDGKSGIVLNSIITMAGWLNLPVLAEGVETARQADYLRTLGCNLIQGYLFSKPLSEADFSAALDRASPGNITDVTKMADFFDNNDFWNPESQSTIIFNSFVGAAGIFEYCDGALSAVRVNDKFFDLAGTPRKLLTQEGNRLLDTIHPDDRATFIDGVTKALETQDDVYTEARWEDWQLRGKYIWLSFRIRKIGSAANRYLLYVSIDNITERKRNEKKLRIQANLLAAENERSRILLEQMGMGTIDYDCSTDFFIYRVKTPEGDYHTITHENYFKNFENDTAVHPRNAAEFQRRVEALTRQAGSDVLDLEIDSYGTGYVPVRIHCTSVAGPDGSVIRMVGLVSERKKH